MSTLKSVLQAFNLVLSIMNKVQTMQHRQIKMAQNSQPLNRRQSSRPLLPAQNTPEQEPLQQGTTIQS